MITGVSDNSPAQTAQLQSGDIITTIDGAKVDSLDTLFSLVQDHQGKETVLTIERGTETLNVTLVPRTNPPEGQGSIGISVSNPSIPVTFTQAVPAAALSTLDQGAQLIMGFIEIILLLTAPVGLVDRHFHGELIQAIVLKSLHKRFQLPPISITGSKRLS